MDEPKILQGAEPFYAESGRTGILVSHGFTGSPQSMRYLAEHLAQAGYTVVVPRLKGMAPLWLIWQPAQLPTG